MQIKVKMWIVGAFLFCGGLAPAVSAQVYKCQAGGRTAYQDKPCEGAREQAPNAVPAAHSGSAGLPAGARPVTPAADLAGLYRQIRAADTEERRLATRYRREVEALRGRAADMSATDAHSEMRTLNARHQQRAQAASAQREALMDELRRRCPNGALLNENMQRCN